MYVPATCCPAGVSDFPNVFALRAHVIHTYVMRLDSAPNDTYLVLALHIPPLPTEPTGTILLETQLDGRRQRRRRLRDRHHGCRLQLPVRVPGIQGAIGGDPAY